MVRKSLTYILTCLILSVTSLASTSIKEQLSDNNFRLASNSNFKANELGGVMTLMYHGLVEKKPHPNYMCTIDEFKQDLQKLYDGGYRLISLNDLLNNNIEVDEGYTPVVLTFDDGLSSAFSLVVGDEGKLAPKEDCAVDIINKFSETHKDFGKTATFFISGGVDIFKGEGSLEDRLVYLIDNGYDIGNHTYSHKSLKNMDARSIQKEIVLLEKLIKDKVPEYNIKTFCYPYGERPCRDFRGLTLKGVYDEYEYEYDVAIREGVTGASVLPYHVDFDPVNFPRVRGSDTARTDLGWHLRYYEDNPGEKYISDGKKNVITVPKSLVDKLNKEAIGSKKIKVV